MPTENKQPRVAVVGGGAAGMAAAWRLIEGGALVTLYETEPEVGGHCFGVRIPGTDIEIDGGVSDFNANTFHCVRDLLVSLGLSVHPINQSASFSFGDGAISWFVREGKPTFVRGVEDPERLWAEIKRFNQTCTEVLHDGRWTARLAGDYLQEGGYGPDLIHRWFVPRAGGCFPMPERHPLSYQICSIVGFWHIHGIVGEPAGRRMVIDGGMHQWPRKFSQLFCASGGTLRTATRVLGIHRSEGGVRIASDGPGGNDGDDWFDQVVLAVNSNQVLSLFEDLAHAQSAALAGLGWQRSRVYIHRDPQLMPIQREAWAAYNYVLDEPKSPARPTITFWPRDLVRDERIPEDVFITVNPHRPPSDVLSVRFLVHPATERPRETAAARLDALQGVDRTWYAGGWTRAPYVHEQAVQSGFEVAGRLLSSWRTGVVSGPRGDFVDFLRDIPMFGAIDACLLEEVAWAAEPFQAKAGTMLFREGGEPDAMLLLARGEVEVSAGARALAILGPGEPLGEMALLDHGPRTANAIARTDVLGWRLDRRRMDALRADTRESAFAIANAIAAKVATRLRILLSERSMGQVLEFPELAALAEQGLPPFDTTSPRAWWADEVLLAAGARADGCLCILSGEVEARRKNGIAFCIGRGGLVGLLACLEGGTSFFEVVAVGPVRAKRIDWQTFSAIRQGRHPNASTLSAMIDSMLVRWYRETLQET